MITITGIYLRGVTPARRPFNAEIPVSEMDKLRYELMHDYDAKYVFFEYDTK